MAIEESSDDTPLPPIARGRGTVWREREFSALYREAFQDCCRLAFALVGDRGIAEEVVQDAFARLLAKWHRVRDPGAYLRRVVVSRCRDVQRRRQVVSRLGLVAVPEVVEHAPDEMHDVLAALPARQRAALTLRYYEDLPIDEIASIMRTRPGTVKSLIHRGLRLLSEEMIEQ